MKALLQRLHAKLGDFWWYSLMLFCAMRAADALESQPRGAPDCSPRDSIRKIIEVQSESFPTDAQISSALAALGLNPEGRYFFGNDLLAITDVSATSDNVLLDDNGKLRFIDPLIRLKKPATEVISRLIG